MKIHQLGSYRNACRVLSNLKDYVNIKRLTENIYYLNKKGREYIASDKAPMTSNMQINHILMRNELQIFMEPESVLIEEPVKDANGNVLLKPDAMFMFDKWSFVEIDNTQKMIVNKRKIEKYGEIMRSGLLQKTMGYHPQLIFLTKSEQRKERLIKLCIDQHLQHVIYTEHDIK